MTDVLPGFIVFGFGVGLVFPASSIAAMFVAGYADGFAAVAAAGAVVAVIALIATPTVRPGVETQASAPG